ncbi:hypothetical protein ZWY2020_039991 [Hordeum vulgare]|nr:hypothetical protein ZWY2020_039991 [Hordeum vulgare]
MAGVDRKLHLLGSIIWSQQSIKGKRGSKAKCNGRWAIDKHPRDESLKHTTMLQDKVAEVGKLDYTKELKEVDVHSKETLYVLFTTNAEAANVMIKKMRFKIGSMRDRIISVDVEYPREDQPN